MIEGYLARVGGVAPQRPLSIELLNRATITKLKALMMQLRFEIETLDIATVRERRVIDLDKAVQDLNRMAERSKSIDHRLRVYQVLAFLCQIIDGLVLNAQRDEITHATRDMEKRLDLLETIVVASQS
jgi:hypothetical protein